MLVVLTFAVFGQVATHAFLNYDDGQFVYENTHVREGLTGSSIAWALTSGEIGYYPITWISHELDVQLWGLDAGKHLLTNTLLHAISACVLFLALLRLTNAFGASAFVAALFAIHPMHVESVAWVSERKDTLSTLFAMLALLLYARAPRRRFGVTIALALSLAAKQMYITLPFVFLLLDYWPLHRLNTLADLKQRVTEKLPLFALTFIGVIAAIIGQRNLRAVQSTTANPLFDRIANAAVAYVRYLAKLFVPVNLATPYPLETIASSTAAGAALLLIAVTIAAVVLRKRAPYLAVGWLWFLGTLVPVIGIVAIGAQSMADRYSYFSYIGIFIIIAFAAIDSPLPRRALVAAGAIVIAIMAAVAFHQVRYWKDSETLFTHTLALTTINPMAEYSLGQTLQLTKPAEAIPHLQRSIEMTRKMESNPEWYAQAHVGLGNALLMKARSETTITMRTRLIDDAMQNYEKALVIDPNAAHAKNNINVARQMLASAPPAPQRSDYDLTIDRALALSRDGKREEALVEYRKAVALQPRSANAHVYLALGLLQAQRPHDAADELRTAKAIDASQANADVMKSLHLDIDDAIARAASQ